MRLFVHHCRRIKRRLYEISEISDLTAHEHMNISTELANYEEYMRSIKITKSDYFYTEYCEIYGMLETMIHGR